MPGKLVNFRNDIQSPIRSKVKYIGAGLLLAIYAARRLHSEYSLHIAGSRGVRSTSKHHNGRPLRNRDSRGKSAA